MAYMECDYRYNIIAMQQVFANLPPKLIFAVTRVINVAEESKTRTDKRASTNKLPRERGPTLKEESQKRTHAKGTAKEEQKDVQSNRREERPFKWRSRERHTRASKEAV